MSQEKKPRRATVYWDDAFNHPATLYKGEFAKELLKPWPMSTTGWIVAENKARIGMAYELDPDGDARRTDSIPRKMVTRIEYLEPTGQPAKEAKAKKRGN